MSKDRSTQLSRADIKELWECYIDIQYQLLQQRAQPIHIDPDKTHVDGNMVCVTIDDRDNDEAIKYILNDVLGDGCYKVLDDCLEVDPEVWGSLTETEKINLSNRLKNHYFDLTPTTNIIATIIPKNRRTNRDNHYTIEEIKELDSLLNKGEILGGKIDATTVCIAQVEIDEDAILRHYFGDNYIFSLKKRKNKNDLDFKIRQYIYHDQYIPQGAYDKYAQEIGLGIRMYVLSFKTEDEDINNKLFDRWENLQKSKDNHLIFSRKFNEGFSSVDAMLREINKNISDFLHIAAEYCQPDKVEIHVDFHYQVDISKIYNAKKNQIENYVAMYQGYSFQRYKNNIGIDFNWRTEDIETVCQKIESEIGDIKIIIRDDHKYKCNVNLELRGIDPILRKIEDSFVSITIDKNERNGVISINVPYTEHNYTLLRSQLSLSLADLERIPQLCVIVSSKPLNKIKLSYKNRNDERIADLERTLAELGKADIGIEDGGRQTVVAKLLQIKFPYLYLDINVSENEKADAIKEAFESKVIHTLIPILTGDIEKLNRLKETFTRASTGDGILNGNLQNYVFDASQATATEGIEDFLRSDSPYVSDMNANLLNTNINESQKQAIIKAVQAEDLAIIQGPPGTGKSTAIAELIWQLIREGEKYGRKSERILLTSETNLAVDNAIARCINNRTNLVKPIRFGDEEKLESEGLMFSMDLMKKWVEKGDAALTDSDDDNDEDENETNTNTCHIAQDIVLRNWLSNISARSFYGEDDDNGTNEVISKWRAILANPDSELRDLLFKEYIKGCNIIGATCSSIGEKKVNSSWDTPFMKKYSEIFPKKARGERSSIEFTTVIQDESSKATPAELVLPLVYGQKSVIIGDHRQLPPMLDREEFEDTLDYALSKASTLEENQRLKHLKSIVTNKFEELEVSHFQRLYEDIDESLKGTFNLQYRMHPAINEVIEQFYVNDGGLACGLTHPNDLGVDSPDYSNFASRYHGLNIPGLIAPDTHVLVVDVDTPEMKDGTSRVNHGEISAIDKILTKLEESETFKEFQSHFSKTEDRQIGLISFYGKQIRLLRSMTRTHLLPIRVSTVDRFQGMERNIVIVSMVRSNRIKFSENSAPDFERFPNTDGYAEQTSLGFAESPNRLNVALSRAKRLLIIVGNREHFSCHPLYYRMYDIIQSSKYNNKIVNASEL